MATKNAIPTIDLSPLRGGSDAEKRDLSRQIDIACTQIGFFIVTGHGVSRDLIAKARQQAVGFFALPLEEKMKVQRPPAKISRGYNWVGDRSIAYSMGQVAPPDIQEAFAFGPEGVTELASRMDEVSARMYAPNIWPERPAGSSRRCCPITRPCRAWHRKCCAPWPSHLARANPILPTNSIARRASVV